MRATTGADGTEASYACSTRRRGPWHVFRSFRPRRRPVAQRRQRGPRPFVLPLHEPSKAEYGRVAATWNHRAVHACRAPAAVSRRTGAAGHRRPPDRPLRGRSDPVLAGGGRPGRGRAGPVARRRRLADADRSRRGQMADEPELQFRRMGRPRCWAAPTRPRAQWPGWAVRTATRVQDCPPIQRQGYPASSVPSAARRSNSRSSSRAAIPRSEVNAGSRSNSTAASWLAMRSMLSCDSGSDRRKPGSPD